MLLYQDPDCPNQPALDLTGGSSVNATGTIYAPKALLNLTGGSGTLGVQIIVSRLIGTGGSTNITVNYIPSLSAKPREPALVE